MAGMTRTSFGERYGRALQLEDRQMQRYAERARAARSAVYAEFFKGIGRGLRAVAAGFDRRRRRRASLRELSALDDGLLRDIGIRRYDIPALADASTAAGRRTRGMRRRGMNATVSPLNTNRKPRHRRWRHTA